MAFLLLAGPGWAQEQPEGEPLYERLKQLAQHDVLSFGLQINLQPVIGFSEDGVRSLTISRARAWAEGTLDHGIGYELKIDAAESRPLLDLMLSYRPVTGLTFMTGLYKVPFSGEYLTSSSELDFVVRARAVDTLAPKRQVGLSFVTHTPDELLTVIGGVFNGTRTLENDDQDFLYAARAELRPGTGRLQTRIGANTVYERSNATLHLRNRLLLGGDVRLEAAPLWLAGEVLYEQHRPIGQAERERFGYHATLGVQPHPHHQLVARLDAFHPTGPEGDGEYLYVFGYNVRPTAVTRIQVNYVAPAGNDFQPQPVEAHGVVLNLQLRL